MNNEYPSNSKSMQNTNPQSSKPTQLASQEHADAVPVSNPAEQKETTQYLSYFEQIAKETAEQKGTAQNYLSHLEQTAEKIAANQEPGMKKENDFILFLQGLASGSKNDNKMMDHLIRVLAVQRATIRAMASELMDPTGELEKRNEQLESENKKLKSEKEKLEYKNEKLKNCLDEYLGTFRKMSLIQNQATAEERKQANSEQGSAFSFSSK